MTRGRDVMSVQWVTVGLSLLLSSVVVGCRDRRTRATPQSGVPSQTSVSRDATGIPDLTVTRLPPGNPILIDGKLDEPAWRNAGSTGEFVNVANGARNENPTLGGRAWLAWDHDYLYLAIDIHDANIRGDFPPDASDPHLWTESAAEVMIDPDGDGDNRDYYEIQIGPQNLIFDSQFDTYNQPRSLPNGPFGHQEWTAGAQTAVTLRGTLGDSKDVDDGYTIEARIPWRSFGKANSAPPRSGDTWRMNFYAMRNNGGLAWSPILGQGNFHKASRFGRVKWLDSSSAR